MRIGVFIKRTTFHKGHGGLETQNKVLCEELVKRGHDVVVFSPKGDFNQEKEILNKVKYYFIEARYYNYILAFFNPNSWVKRSFEFFHSVHQENPFDIVLSQSSGGEAIIKNKHKLKIPVITISHGSISSEIKTYLQTNRIQSLKDVFWLIRNIQYFLRQFFGRQRLIILNADKVIAVSNFVKESLIEETFCPEERIEVVNNGIDTNTISNIEVNASEENKTNLIYLGRIDKSKGVYDLLDIFKKVDKKNTFLHFVGDGPELEKLKSLNSNPKIIFHGMKKHSEALSLLKRSDIFVFPTKRIEGFPMVLVEAAFCKLPVVAYNKGGTRDAVHDKETGYLIEEGNAEEFVCKLKYLIENEEARLELGENNYKYAMDNLTITKMIDKYEKIIKETFEAKK